MAHVAAIPNVEPGTTSDAPNDLRFAVFSAINPEAQALLDHVRLASSPLTLKGDEDAIGYELSISLSEDGDFTWAVGAGPDLKKGVYDRKIDILLCPPGKSPGTKLYRNHIKDFNATIYFHLHSGVLLLKSHSSSKPVVYEKGDVNGNNLILKSGNTCVLRRRNNYIWFGQYCFAIQFVLEDQDCGRFNARLEKNIGYRYHGSRPSKLLTFIPTTTCKTSWNIWLHHKIANSSVTSGVNMYTGQPVAVKKLYNKAKARRDETDELNRQYMVNRLKVAHNYKHNLDSGLLGVSDVWCEYKESSPCRTDKQTGKRKVHKSKVNFVLLDEQNEMFNRCGSIFYAMPLAEYNFRNLGWRRESASTRLLYFHQTLSGLNELHKQRIVHKNIVPESLLILADTDLTSSMDSHSLPRKAVISLYMQRLEKPEASVCVAPEVWEDVETLNDTEADVWALAASWLCAFIQVPSNIKITKTSYKTLCRSIDLQFKEGYIEEPLLALLLRMLAWEPRDRPSVQEALEDEAWESISVQKLAKLETERADIKRKLVEHHPENTKRARILSPIDTGRSETD